VHLFGIIDQSLIPADNTPGRVSYIRTQFRWNRLPQALTNPDTLARALYGWGGSFRHEEFTRRLQNALYAFGIPVSRRFARQPLVETYYSPSNPVLKRLRELRAPLMIRPDIDGAPLEFGFVLLPIPPRSDPNAAPVGFLISPYAKGDFGDEFPVGG
jgi:hypothetical protein